MIVATDNRIFYKMKKKEKSSGSTVFRSWGFGKDDDTEDLTEEE